ncbi:phage portal protein [uncultured Clostridium sp.]|uniref:phage portal protein n=1 Tax=uncultured Clostridium sp. TaxID=59620 RepID=UPI0025D59A43|nr:phage portal protein [uncultured Clostridium sp.]
MILDMNDQKDIGLLRRMYTEYTSNLTEYQKAYDYYIGKTDIQETYKETERSNRKVQDNFIKTFVDEEVAFMVGVPITYGSKTADNESVKAIGNTIDEFDTCCDIDLATDFLIYGTAYEYYYLVDKKIKTKTYSPLNSIAYIDNNDKVQLFIYFYTEPFDERKQIYMNIIDDKYIYHYDSEFHERENMPRTEHYFKSVPIGFCKMKNGLQDTIYKTSKSLQDVYEEAMSDWSNEISDTRLAYLLVTGMELDEEIAAKIKEKGIIQCDDVNGKAQFVTKNIDAEFIKSYRDIIKEDIYRVNHHIDNQMQLQSNTSGNMLAVRINCLRIKITKQNKALEYAVRGRLKYISIYLDIAKDKGFDCNDITIKTQLNLPANDVETAQIVSQMAGKLSIRTGLERLSFITNGEEEFQKMLEEQKMINKNDMEDIPGLPKKVDTDESE